MSWTNDWDFPENGIARCFEGKIKTQVEEGDPDPIRRSLPDLVRLWT